MKTLLLILFFAQVSSAQTLDPKKLTNEDLRKGDEQLCKLTMMSLLQGQVQINQRHVVHQALAQEIADANDKKPPKEIKKAKDLLVFKKGLEEEFIKKAVELKKKTEKQSYADAHAAQTALLQEFTDKAVKGRKDIFDECKTMYKPISNECGRLGQVEARQCMKHHEPKIQAFMNKYLNPI